MTEQTFKPNAACRFGDLRYVSAI